MEGMETDDRTEVQLPVCTYCTCPSDLNNLPTRLQTHSHPASPSAPNAATREEEEGCDTTQWDGRGRTCSRSADLLPPDNTRLKVVEEGMRGRKTGRQSDSDREHRKFVMNDNIDNMAGRARQWHSTPPPTPPSAREDAELRGGQSDGGGGGGGGRKALAIGPQVRARTPDSRRLFALAGYKRKEHPHPHPVLVRACLSGMLRFSPSLASIYQIEEGEMEVRLIGLPLPTSTVVRHDSLARRSLQSIFV